MDRSELYEKAKELPLLPGVYIMKNRAGAVIYVGKSKLLRNRVTSYFMPEARHNAKTEKMVAAACDFEVYFTASEIEALVLENQFIKQYMPRYNIKLKDSKSYPYIKLTAQEYPRLRVVYTRTDDGTYFGPFSSASAAYSIAGAVEKAAMLPQCKKQFPRDFGTKPCLNYHIGTCIAPCCKEITHSEYMLHAAAARRILRGEIRPLIKELTAQMDKSSEELMFEQAARYRDCIAAVKKLDSQQKIVTAPDVNEDVFGFYADELGSSAAVLMIRSGAVKDRMHWFFRAEEILDSSACANIIQRYYQQLGFIPACILCDSLLTDDDAKLTEAYLNTLPGAHTAIFIPEKGDKRKIVRTANENARELLLHERTALRGEREFLLRLTQFLSLEIVPERIEAYDISNNGQNDTTAGMTVIENGRFCKRKYRSFNIKSVENDDYGAMSEAITRRFSHTGQGWELPDLILADGGAGHVGAVKKALSELNIDLPVLGMIKDEFHKTRTLTDGENEISIARNQEIFVFFYKIQEEVHRFTVSRMDVRRRTHVKKSSLEQIQGIGTAKARALNARFGGLRGIKQASREELLTVKGITHANADSIINALQGDSGKDRRDDKQ